MADNPAQAHIVAVFGHNGWELIEKNEFGDVQLLICAPTLDELLRTALYRGYLKPPIAIKLGEM